jgi:hypothetical protein
MELAEVRADQILVGSDPPYEIKKFLFRSNWLLLRPEAGLKPENKQTTQARTLSNYEL